MAGKKFVVQEHNATTLHWDFRLEMEGVLKSWAVTKEPPLEEGIKRLAIEVVDHSLEYGNFEGEIKEGYGKGSVKIWDKGSYELISRDEKKIEFDLKGRKLKGRYVLVYTGYGAKKKGWLFFKVG